MVLIALDMTAVRLNDNPGVSRSAHSVAGAIAAPSTQVRYRRPAQALQPGARCALPAALRAPAAQFSSAPEPQSSAADHAPSPLRRTHTAAGTPGSPCRSYPAASCDPPPGIRNERKSPEYA